MRKLVSESHLEELVNWRDFCRQVFGIKAEVFEVFGGIEIPPQKDGLTKLAIMPAGLTLLGIVDVYEEHIPVKSFISDEWMHQISSVRRPESSYAFCYGEGAEADEDFEGMSADDILQASRGLVMTFPERLVVGLNYYLTHGVHLDQKTTTLCPTSRSHRNLVPSVRYKAEEKVIVWNLHYPAKGCESERARRIAL